MAADGQIVIDVVLDDGNVAQGVADINGQFDDLDRNGNSRLSSVGAGFKKLATVAAVGAAAVVGIGAAIGGLAAPLVRAAGDAQAMNAQFETVFGTLEKSATQALNKIADQTGIIPERLKGSFTQIAAFAKTTGMDTAGALALTERATLAAADSAAFYDKSIEEVTESLQSFLKGNFENDAALGISATETTRNAKANELYGKSFIKLDEAQKQLTLMAMVEDGNKLSGALGQAARETDGLENVLGNLKQAWENLKVVLGGPLLEPAVEGIKALTKAMQNFDPALILQAFEVMKTVVSTAIDTIKIYVQTGLEILKQFWTEHGASIVTAIQTAFETIKLFIQTAIEAIRSIWDTNGASIIESARNIFETVKLTIQTVLEAVVPFIQEKLAIIKQFWDENGAQIIQAVTNAFNTIKAIIDFVMPAVLFVIDMVWTAIKQVISGALDIIMGAIKIFTGLFTGDFSKMWEGVKQLFFGAIDLILGWMTLTFVGGIRTLVTNLAKGAFNILKGMWDDIVKIFTNMGTKANGIVSGMVKTVVGFFKGLYDDAARIFGTLKTFGANTWEALKQAVVTTVTNLVNSVKTKFMEKLASIKTSMSEISITVKNIWNQIIAWIKGKVADFVQIGKDLISGLVKGISEMSTKAIEAVTGVVDGVINKAKNLLGIHSPSRVFAQIGVWLIEGWAIGIEKTGNRVVGAVSDIALLALDIAEHYASEEIKIRDKANADIAQIEKRAAEDVSRIQQAAYAKRRATNEQENIKIQRIQEDAVKKVKDIKAKSIKEIVELDAKMNKDLLDETKRYIDDKKSLDQLSLIDEARIWEQSIKLFNEGSAEKIRAQQAYKKAVEAVNNEIVNINKTYQSQMQTISDELIKQIDEQNKKYDEALKNRQSSLMSFAGTFDEFKVEMKKSGTDLLSNLQSQVDGFKTWQDQFAELSNKGIDADLLDELSALGPKALPELMALNQLTDEQLSQYSALYQEKAMLARTQAEAELSGMKEDTATKIDELKAVANEKLSALQIEWNQAIVNLTQATSTELSSLKQIGVDAGQGLYDGLASMEGSLVSKAQQIAEAIKSTIQSALDIHSPSRWMRDFVAGNMAKGYAVGVDKNESLVTKAASQLGEMMKPDTGVINKLRGVRANLGNLGTSSLQNINSKSNTNNYNQSRKTTNNVTVQGTGDNGADVQRALRRVTFQLG